MTDYVFNPFTPVPANAKSHVRGWALHWAEMLGAVVVGKDDDLGEATALYLDHGVNFGGGLNLFGGVTPDVIERLYQVVESGAKLVSLDMPMPNYVEQLRKRLGQATCDPRLEALLPALDKVFAKAETLTNADLVTHHVTIGDSHSTAFAPKGSPVLRTNGQTLFGALRDGLIEKEIGLFYSLSSATLVFGSIDIRHHIGRQPDPMDAAVKLAKDYAELVKRLSGEHMIAIEVAAPMPAEFEGRKIPQTGFYKGTPFTGSAGERSAWTNLFIDILRQEGAKVVWPPRRWYHMDREEFAKTYMELGSSVHLAPPYYRRNNWGAA